MPVKLRHEGGILIEFVFSVPVCIALLFFVHDHYRYYELKNKIKMSTLLAASMVQHVTKNRADKQLTLTDVKNITHACGFNIFHTKSMFRPHPLGIYLSCSFVYVKRLDSENYEKHHAMSVPDNNDSPKTTHVLTGHSTETLRRLKLLSPELICQNDGEEKVLVKCLYFIRREFEKKLGFLIMKPREFWTRDVALNCCVVFFDKVVITPKPGLFPVKEE